VVVQKGEMFLVFFFVFCGHPQCIDSITVQQCSLNSLERANNAVSNAHQLQHENILLKRRMEALVAGIHT